MEETAAATPKKTQQAVTAGGSALGRYRRVIIGSAEWLRLLRYELCVLFAPFRGAPGLVLRSLTWPGLLGACGKGTQFGANISLMHPHRIETGRRCVFGDNCILDARTPQSEKAIRLGDDVILSHGVMLSAIGGEITIGNKIGLGAYTIVRSTERNPVTIGDNCAIGPQCYICGGGNYNTSRLDIPISQQGHQEMGGSCIEEGVWLGAHVSVLGGVTIGHDSIVGTGAVVTKSIPPFSVAVGVPARVVQTRT